MSAEQVEKQVSEFNIDTAVTDFTWPGRVVERETRNGTAERGFDRHIWVKVNGWVFSATWNYGTYCSGARPAGNTFDLADPSPKVSPDAEIAVWPEGSRKLMALGDDTVVGWVTPARFIAALEAAARDDEAGIRSALATQQDAEQSP